MSTKDFKITKLPDEAKRISLPDDGVNCKMVYRIAPSWDDITVLGTTPDTEAIELVVFENGEVCFNPAKGSTNYEEDLDGIGFLYPSQVVAVMMCLQECGIKTPTIKSGEQHGH